MDSFIEDELIVPRSDPIAGLLLYLVRHSVIVSLSSVPNITHWKFAQLSVNPFKLNDRSNVMKKYPKWEVVLTFLLRYRRSKQ